jgi:hypothetical protein
MAKSKKLAFQEGDKVYIDGVQFQIIKIKNGNVTVRPIGGYDMAGEAMVPRQPVLEKIKDEPYFEE